MAVYRAYLRTFAGEVSEKTITNDKEIAEEAFRSLVDRVEHDGQKFAAALTCNNRQVAFHRFDRGPGDADYWRDRVDEIEWPMLSHGGAGRGQGRTPLDGAQGVTRRTITIDPDSESVLRDYGDGELSLGVRRAAALVQKTLDQRASSAS